VIRGALWVILLMACAGRSPEVETPRDNAPPQRTVVSLRLNDLSGQAPLPRSSLELVLVHDHAEREISPVGEILGICTHDAVPPRGLLASVRCWWHGEETHYSARRVGESVEVRRGEETLLEAPIPADVETHSLNE
jgi:hypothetical protein